MSSKGSINYIVYELWSYFSEPPEEILCCPACENPVSITRVTPSMAVSKYYADRFLHKHESYAYECKTCTWWAVRESWVDYELNVNPDYLIVGGSNGNKENLPWVQVLENEHLYESPNPIPDSIAIWFSHGKRRKQTSS